MKRQIAILLIILLCLGLCVGLTGCDHPKVSVSSELSINESFSGTRTITAVYPLSEKIDSVKDTIVADDPTAGIDGASFSYIGVEDDGYYFELKLTFGSKEEYEKIVSALIGRNVTVFMSQKNTSLTQGTRMAEDFDVRELIAWMVNDTAANDDVKKLEFTYDANTVKIGSESFSTDSTISINECTGSEINSISVKTSNDKAGKYNRTFAFSIPMSTYSEDQEAIKAYFKDNTLPDAKYAGWSNEGSNVIYNVIYEELSIDEMKDVTAKILDTDSCEIFYGDKNNSSTPLSEGLTFEEYLDTFSFIGPSDGFPTLYYTYSLPLNTTYGEGSVFEDGRWVSAGQWENDLYTVELKSGSAKIRIPDGIQYSITGIDFELVSLGDSRFRRITDFKYDKTDGRDDADYAMSYFAGKGVESELIENDDSLVCHVAFEGTTEEITSKLVAVFGSGNFMAYEQDKGSFDLSIKTELTDYVNLGYMLNAENAACPMTYTVSSQGGENIVSISVDGSETAYAEHSSGTLTINKGCGTVQYHGNIPVTHSIVIYLVSGFILLALTAFVAIKLIKPKKPKSTDPLEGTEELEDFDEVTPDEAEETEKPKKTPLSQTTTFSIFELNTLVRNKKYVDEINKDVEARLHAQSLEEQKHDIRAKELEDLSRKVYGDNTGEEEPAPEDPEQEELEPEEAKDAAPTAEPEEISEEETGDD